MKRNKLMMTAAIAGSVLLVSSIVGFAASGSGYQDYKKAVKATAFLNNATVSIDMQLKDNGSIIMAGNSVVMDDNIQSAQSNSYTASSFVVDGKTHKIETSTVDGRVITNINGKYTAYAFDVPDSEAVARVLNEDSSTVKLAEMIIDTLVGDVRNQFVKNGNQITVNLEGAQIPELARLGISAIMENIKQEEEMSMMGVAADSAPQALFNRIPQLETIDVEYLGMQGEIEDGILADSSYQAIVTGTDPDGMSHKIEINMTMKVSEIGTTVPKSIDTTGKDVKEFRSIDTNEVSKVIIEMRNNGASEEEIEAYVEQMHRSGTGLVMKAVEIKF